MTNDELRIQIGQNLSRYRLEQGFTREHVSNAIGVSASFYAAAENGKRMMRLHNLLKAADFFNIDLDSLVRGEQDQNHINNISKLLEEQPKYVLNHIENYTRFCVNDLFADLKNNDIDIRDLID